MGRLGERWEPFLGVGLISDRIGNNEREPGRYQCLWMHSVKTMVMIFAVEVGIYPKVTVE